MPQTLTDIQSLLIQRGLRPKHRLGQNFLHDGNQMRRIMEAADLQPNECVLEIGPGTGALTERLLAAGARVIAVEIDADMQPILEQQTALWREQCRLIIGDVLAGKHALNAQMIEALGESRFKLIANLPYHVAGPLLINLIKRYGPRLTRGVVMVQKEVAQRLTAGPGGKDYGPLGIVVQAMCETRVLYTLSPGCFWPNPKVSSAVLHLTQRSKPLTDDADGLAAFVQRLFQKRRKQLRAILGGEVDWPDGVVPTDRPEQLAIEQLVALCAVAPPSEN